MSEFKAAVQDLEGKLAEIDAELNAMGERRKELNERRDKIQKALDAVLELDGAPAGAASARRSAPPPARGKGAAMAGPKEDRTCAGCGGTRWKAYAHCYSCGKPKCGACGVRGRTKTCTSCAKTSAPARPAKAAKASSKKHGAAWRGFTIKKTAAAPAPAAAPAAPGKKKCEGCGESREGEFATCESCGADYCKASCLRGGKDCPACQRLARSED